MTQCFHGTVNVLLISYFSREADKSEPIIRCGWAQRFTGLHRQAVVHQALRRTGSGITGDVVMQGVQCSGLFQPLFARLSWSARTVQGERAVLEQLMVKTWCTVSDGNGISHMNH